MDIGKKIYAHGTYMTEAVERHRVGREGDGAIRGSGAKGIFHETYKGSVAC